MTTHNPPESEQQETPISPANANNSAGLFSRTWLVTFGIFLGVATLGATIPEPWWVRLLFFALSIAIGVFAIFRAVKEKNWLAIGLSAIVTVLIAILSIWQLSGPVSSFFTPTPETEPRPLPLPPRLHGAPDPLKDRFVGRAREFLELDAAWEGIVSGKSS
ncbi:MAG: hypothetical protein KJO08_04910, partial [Gammaproteobacteria bacterium]|nr:hypothetical protein [Gammaproteobacteria bacterium]NNJ85083.1 hypothetical protein [Gammaproteobacteria bacterium]